MHEAERATATATAPRRPNRVAEREAGLAIPYLGPDPLDSIPAGRFVVVACALAAGVRLFAAWVMVQRADIDRRLAAVYESIPVPASTFDHPAPTITDPGLLDEYHRNVDLSRLLGTLSLLTAVLAIAVLFAWRRQRRSKPVLRSMGETHVESPLRWAIPQRFQFLLSGLVLAGVLASTQGRATATTPVGDLAELRHWSALANVLFAAFWALDALQVRIAERSHARRLAASTLHRQGLAPVSYVAAVADSSGIHAGEPAGLGWMLRTAGLFFVALTATGILIGAVFGRDPEIIPWAIGALVADGLVVRAGIRRFRPEVEPAPSPPAPAGAPS